MNKILVIAVLGFRWFGCFGGKPEIPNDDLFPFVVYFESRSRGLCVGSLVSRVVALTAAVCVADIYVPDNFETRHYMLQKSVALLLLKRRVPDILTEQPLRAVDVDEDGDDQIAPNEDCVIIGWHFFYSEDKILPSKWFMLHKHMRYQRLRIMDTEKYCGSLLRQYEIAEGFNPGGNLTRSDALCLQDGMYGAPLVCASGRVVGLLSAPDAQPRGCTGHTAIVHRLSNPVNRDFLRCVKKLFDPEYHVKWGQNWEESSSSDC